MEQIQLWKWHQNVICTLKDLLAAVGDNTCHSLHKYLGVIKMQLEYSRFHLGKCAWTMGMVGRRIGEIWVVWLLLCLNYWLSKLPCVRHISLSVLSSTHRDKIWHFEAPNDERCLVFYSFSLYETMTVVQKSSYNTHKNIIWDVLEGYIKLDLSSVVSVVHK